MAIYGYTKNYKLIKPQFNTDTWHDYIYDNLDTIDAVMSAIYASGNWKGFWATNTVYTVGDVIIDKSTDTMYKVMVDHTTSEATFAEEFAAHPTYYELWSPNNLAESWAIKMDDVVSNTDYSSKAYAISSGLIDAGSAKEWAIGSGEVGDTGEYSAKKYATDAHDDYISMTTDVNVIAVGTNIANVNAVGQSISNVNTVASDISSVNTVAGVSTDVTTVASIATAVSNVSGIESEVLDVSDNRTDISTVASNIGDVNTVADISTDVSTVADNDANVTTVATNISDVNTAATNIAAIIDAPTQASNAAASATLAQEWATKMDGQVASTDYSSKYYAGQAATSADNSHVWAEGTDEQVQALGGVHSSKVWAEQSTNANTDLSNLTATGENHFANPALTNSPYTTNRILEIPQDIKYELANYVLKLKTGSKLYRPNGFEADGVTPHFDTITTENDLIAGDSTANTMSGNLITNGVTFFELIDPVACFSGNTAPTSVGWLIWWDTANNIIKLSYDGGSTWDAGGYALPTLVAHRTYNVGYDRIEYVFNGIGNIGDTRYALPDLEVQIPEKRNADGTPKFRIYKNDRVRTQTINGLGNGLYSIYIDENTFGVTTTTAFNADLNYTVDTDGYHNGTMILGNFLWISGKAVSWKMGSVDSVANSNASNFSAAGRSYLSGLGKPSSKYEDWTLGASGSTYTAPANGYICLNKGSSAAGQYVYLANYTRGIVSQMYSASNGEDDAVYLPVKKSDTFWCSYTAGGQTNVFRFTYAEGEI